MQLWISQGNLLCLQRQKTKIPDTKLNKLVTKCKICRASDLGLKAFVNIWRVLLLACCKLRHSINIHLMPAKICIFPQPYKQKLPKVSDCTINFSPIFVIPLWAKSQREASAIPSSTGRFQLPERIVKVCSHYATNSGLSYIYTTSSLVCL